MNRIVILFFFFLSINSFAQDKYEYAVLRVEYKRMLGEYSYKLYLDIGKNGSHSLAGKIENLDGVVVFHDDNGPRNLESDVDLLNLLGKKGWHVSKSGKNKILDKEYTEFLLVRHWE